MAGLLTHEVVHQLRAVALHLPVEEREAGIGDHREEEEVEEDQEKLLLGHADCGDGSGGLGTEQAVLLSTSIQLQLTL